MRLDMAAIRRESCPGESSEDSRQIDGMDPDLCCEFPYADRLTGAPMQQLSRFIEPCRGRSRLMDIGRVFALRKKLTDLIRDLRRWRGYVALLGQRSVNRQPDRGQ